MQKITKKGWTEIGICAGAFVVIAVLAAFFDLAINKALYNPNSLFGQYFDKLGELPSYLAAPIVGTILFHQDFGKTKTHTILWKVVSAALVFVGWYYAIGSWFWGNFIRETISYSVVYKIVFCLILTACALLATVKVDKKVMRKLLVLALFIAVVAALSNVIVQIMKILWSRQRFRTMVDNDANAELIATYVRGGDLFQGFSPWYKPEFLFKSPLRAGDYVSSYKAIDHDAFKSFPSGHTVAASASFFLIILPDMYSKFAKYKWMFWVFPAIYTALVGISRIVMGAHYLSDILFGGFIGFAVAALARWFFVSHLGSLYGRFDIPQDSRIIVLSQ
ncbi:MAG: phosphatase PAP2 family protein [Clostridia bacterium]|nr:phosphatase PAP2 family protein [Clostridia bacterium]